MKRIAKPAEFFEQLFLIDQLPASAAPVYDGDFGPGPHNAAVSSYGGLVKIHGDCMQTWVELDFNSSTAPEEVWAKLLDCCHIFPNKFAAEQKLQKTKCLYRKLAGPDPAVPDGIQVLVCRPEDFGVIPIDHKGRWGLFCNLDRIAVYSTQPNEWESLLELV